MAMAMKNAVTVKKTPSFWSTCAVTKNLDFMNSLTKKQAKANKNARESKWKVAESCAWTWTDTKAMSMAEAKQKPIIISVQSMWIWWRCTTTKPAASAGAAPPGSTASSLAAASSGTSELTLSPEDEGCGCCEWNFEMSVSNCVNIFHIHIRGSWKFWFGGYCFFMLLIVFWIGSLY